MRKKIITIVFLTILTLSSWSNVYAETQGEVNLSVTVLPRLTIDDFDFSEINPNAVSVKQSEDGKVAGATSKNDQTKENIFEKIYNKIKVFFENILI